MYRGDSWQLLAESEAVSHSENKFLPQCVRLHRHTEICGRGANILVILSEGCFQGLMTV